MGAGSRGGDDERERRKAREDVETNLAHMIVQELALRDEALALCAELEALPSEGPEIDVLRSSLSVRADELRNFLAHREVFLRALPSPGRLYARIELDDPECDVEAAQVALVAETASAAFAAVAANVRLFAVMRRCGLPL